MTSLTVQPKWFFTAFRSSSATSANATRRCGVIAWLNEVFGALKGDGGGMTPESRLCSETCSAVSTIRRAALTALTGLDASCVHAADQQVDLGRHALGVPVVVIGVRRRIGLEIEPGCGELRARYAVDGGVVHLHDDRLAAPFEALDDVHLPQRALAVQGQPDHLAHESLELRPAARRRQAGAAHVVVEVEVRVLDPHRVAPA